MAYMMLYDWLRGGYVYASREVKAQWQLEGPLHATSFRRDERY